MNCLDKDEDLLLVKLNEKAFIRGKRVYSQYACEITDFSSHYGNDRNISYVAQNILGPPTVYPRWGDDSSTFQMRRYGVWWEDLPSHLKSNAALPACMDVESQDFIEFRVQSQVVPKTLRIYEVYNPSSISKIFCFSYELERWVTLWHGKPQMLTPEKAYCFQVAFEDIKFKTDLYRIEFHYKHLNYYAVIDSLTLYGEIESNPAKFVTPTSCTCTCDDRVIPIASSSKDGIPYFEMIPEEVIHLIMSYLDLQSLCILSQVSKFFKRICYDPVFYKDLNLQYYWNLVDYSTLPLLQPRLASLKQLNMSWCGTGNRITDSLFSSFLQVDCQFLVRLQLSNCPFVTDKCMEAIATNCHLLEELELRSCKSKHLTRVGFRSIAEMSNLKYLDLYRTHIRDEEIIMIIRNGKLEHLFLGSCDGIKDPNDVAEAIACYLGRSIRTLDLWRIPLLNCFGIVCIGQSCPNLVEFDISWCHDVNAECGCMYNLIMNCHKLKKLFLGVIRSLTSRELNAIAENCPDLEQLCLLGTVMITPEAVINILQSCHKMKLLDISFTRIEDITHLQKRFPNVQIKYWHSHRIRYN